MSAPPPLPGVVFGFNRPEKLARILEALRGQGLERLLIFIDGPRHSGELPAVEACRALARQVDWTETELTLWEENHGLPGLADNLRLVFERHPWAVIIEDDCLPMPGFYPFMRQALLRYRDDPSIFSIGGYQPVWPGRLHSYPYNLVSTTRFMCWGWATWAGRWQQVYPHLSEYAGLFNDLSDFPLSAGPDLPEMARLMAAGRLGLSWDVQVAVVTFWLRQVHLLATHGLVRNLGMDRSGMHTGRASALRDRLLHNRNLVAVMPPELEWLPDTSLSEEYTRQLGDFIRLSQLLTPRRQFQRLRHTMRQL